jgi:hypothetical protein
LYSKYFKGIQWIPFLDYIGYEKETALLHLKQNFAYKPYPYKHYENIFTRFYQGYILPTKFNVDKRRVHFSSLIMSGQMDRDYALTELKKPAFSSVDELRMDIEYFLKKLQWESTKLEQYLIRPRREHSDYKTDKVRKYLWPVLRFTGRTRVALQRLLR